MTYVVVRGILQSDQGFTKATQVAVGHFEGFSQTHAGRLSG